MSRVAKSPIIIPSTVDVVIDNRVLVVKGNNGELTLRLNKAIEAKINNNMLTFYPKKDQTDGWAQAGTARSLLNSMIIGVTVGFIKKLQLVGVGYRVTVRDNILSLSLGFSHSIDYKLLSGITAECPSQTEIVLKSANKQLIGQVASFLRSYRPPEPYKGKGVRYAEEVVHIKESKRK